MKHTLLTLLTLCLLLVAVSAVTAQTTPDCRDAAGAPIPCPDRDGDGVQDSVDRCVSEAGPSSNAGCPESQSGQSTGGGSTGSGDTDNDGIPDSSDQCATVAGIADYSGCSGPTATPIADSDADGEHDGIDQCLHEPGPAENKGCPVVSTTGGSIVPTLTPVGLDVIAVLHPLPDNNTCSVATATSQAVNLRAKPSMTAEVLTSVSPDESFFVLFGVMSEGLLWYHLEVVNGEWAGYVASTVMRATKECEFLEIFNLMPLPDSAKLDLNLTTPIEDPNALKVKMTDILVSSLTGTPGSADGSVKPGLTGPTDLGMCLYHPDYGFVICTPDPDGTFDPAAAQTIDPSTREPQHLGMCLYNPDYGYIMCNHGVEDGHGRIGQMSLICTVDTNRCMGEIVTFPEDPASDCSAAIAIPNLLAARRAANEAREDFINIETLIATLPDPDPCAPTVYGLDVPLDQINLNFASPAASASDTRPASLMVWNSPTLPTPPEQPAEVPDDGATEGHCSTGGGISGCSVSLGQFSFSAWYDSKDGVGGAICHNSEEGVQTCIP